jgi:dipeptidyl aminopeptidase/acylaminoacyl peptidase
MPRLLGPGLALVVAFVVASASAPVARQQAPAGRALTLEDYYRIQTVGNPAISPGGKWVSFTVSTRIEEDNGTRTETWLVPADGSSKPRRALHYGRAISGARWTDKDRLEYTADVLHWTIDPTSFGAQPVRSAAARPRPPAGGRGARGDGASSTGVPSPDGQFVATTVDKTLPRREPASATDFERRHEERFKGVTFDSSTGYGEAFKWATWGEWGWKDGEDVVSGIDYVLARFPIDPKRVGHTGHSYGGFMTNWLITQYPDRFAAAITGAGITNWTSDYGTADIYRTKETEFYGPPWDPAARERMIKQSPLTYAGRVKTPTLFVHGEVDQRVPYDEAEQMYFALKRRGVPAKMIQYAGQPHGIGGHWNNVHRMMNELRWWNT